MLKSMRNYKGEFMSAIKPDLTVKSYAERSALVREIQSECSRAERGEQVDLKQTAQKLNGLVQRFNEDAKAINLGTKISLDVRQAYDLHKTDLSGLNARVNSLAAKTKSVPAWIKPVVYSALGVAGVAATAFVLYQAGIFAAGPVNPTPVPTPVNPTPVPTPVNPTPAKTGEVRG